MCVREFMFYYFIYWCFIIFVLLLLEQIVCVYVCVCVWCVNFCFIILFVQV